MTAETSGSITRLPGRKPLAFVIDDDRVIRVLIEMVLAKADGHIAAEYDRRLVPEDLRPLGADLRDRLQRAIARVLDVTQHRELLESNPVLRRSIDVRNPYQAKEIAYYIPAITEATDKRCIKVDGKDRCKTAIQTNNAETDDRGYIYIIDRANTGMHILELTGDARKAAGLP